jgi:hypothetical protein
VKLSVVKILKFLAKFLVLIFTTLFLIEICYRFNVINFYKAENLALNSKQDLENSNIDIMVFGDSFSATSKEINYVDMLRKNTTKPSVLNFSVPGIGIRQVNTFASSKIKKHNPKVILYQVYVGNDLIDVNHIWSLEKFSMSRNLYWEASDYFLSLSYLNHKATIFRPRINSRTYTMAEDSFVVDYYDARTRRFLNFNPSFFNDMVMLKKPFNERYEEWLSHMNYFLETIPKDIKVYVLWIPHCTQVNDHYSDNFKKLGSSFDDKPKVQQSEYPYFSNAKKDLEVYKNVTQLNPLEFFQTRDSITSRLYFENDPHINYTGNKVLNDFLQTKMFPNAN